jgi:Poxvirus A32 protein
MKSTLEIKGVGSGENDYLDETPVRMQNKLFPGFPTTALFAGPPGSGKTNTLVFMLMSPDFWNGFFDRIYGMGPTLGSDSLYKRLDIPDEQICTDAKKFVKFVTDTVSEQQTEVEANKKEAKKTLWIFEDLTSFFHKIQHKEDFIRCFCQIRHLKGTAVAVVHKYKSFNRTCRNCCRHILIWQPLITEIKQLYEDFGPPNMPIKEWTRMVQYASSPTEEDPHTFFYINMKAPIQHRYRKKFTEILQIPTSIPPQISNKKRKQKDVY